MAEPRGAGTAMRVFVSVVAVATTAGGALVMTVHDEHAGRRSELDAPSLESPYLEPLPSLDPTSVVPSAPARRPTAIATTRSSR